MTLRPLGWELSFLLVAVAVLSVGFFVDSTALVGVSVLACAVATPLLLMSFLVRLIAGILEDARGRRAVRPLGR